MAKMYYTAEEAAERLGITQQDLEQYQQDQRLRVFKDGDRDMYMVSEVDSIAPVTAANVPDVELAPAPDGVDLSAAETLRPATKEDTVITAEGISIFDDEDLEIESADPMAKTQIAPSIEDQIALDGVGSGSGLLDLTRESDDTSLGEVIDHIDLEEPAVGAPISQHAPAATVYGDVAPTMVMEAEPAMDAMTGLFSGLLVGAALVGLLVGVICLSVAMGKQAIVATLDEQVMMVVLGGAALVALLGVGGMFLGKAMAEKQGAIDQMNA